MFHGKPIPSLGELGIVWKLSNLKVCIELCVGQRLLNKIRIRTRGDTQVPHHQDGFCNTSTDWGYSACSTTCHCNIAKTLREVGCTFTRAVFIHG